MNLDARIDPLDGPLPTIRWNWDDETDILPGAMAGVRKSGGLTGTIELTDDEGSVEVTNSEGKRELTVKNKKGETTFKGPINTPEDHKKLPPEVLSRLNAIGSADMDDNDNDLEIETKVVDPATKTRRILPPPGAPEAGMRSL